MPSRIVAPVLLALVLTGCYHQVVRTGAPAGNTVIELPWTATYLFGLVPASTINTSAQCPSGVAAVETQQTFVNGLVGVLTLGIYTPQTVRITCAAQPMATDEGQRIHLPEGANSEVRSAAVRAAVAMASRSGERVWLVGF